MNSLLKKIKGSKGFTLIELLVVIAVLAILVLLGMMRFGGQIDAAQIARIGNDVKVAENKTQEYLTNKDNLKDWEMLYGVIDDDDLNNMINQDRLYDKKGLVDTYVDGDFVIIPTDFVEEDVRSKLKGAFFANKDGEVYYSHDKVLGTIKAPEVNEEYVLANDNDFKREPIPMIEGEKVQRYEFIYRGRDKYVEVPHVLYGQPVTSYRRMFSHADVHGVKSTNKNIVNMQEMFYNNWNISGVLDLSELDMSNVEQAWGMLYQTNAKGIIIDGWDISNLKNFAGIFTNTNVGDGDIIISNIKGSENITDLDYAFNGITANKLDIRSINTSNALTSINVFQNVRINEILLNNFTPQSKLMSDAFYNAKIKKLNWEEFKTDNVVDMWRMFGNSTIENIDFSYFNTENVTAMGSMFLSSNIEELDLSSFDTSNVEEMGSMFNSSTAKYIDVSSFSIDNFDNFYASAGMFANMKDLEELDISNLNFTNVKLNGLTAHRIFNDSNFKKIYVKDQDNLNFLQIYSDNELPLYIK